MKVQALLRKAYDFCTKDPETIQKTAITISALAIDIFFSHKWGLLVLGSFWLPILYKGFMQKRDINQQPVFPKDASAGTNFSIRQFTQVPPINVPANLEREIDNKKAQIQGVKGLREFVQWLENQRDLTVKRFSFDSWICGKCKE